MQYNPSNIGLDNGKIFGLPFNYNDAQLIILPVPWELTTSFGNGTSKAPKKILEVSRQLDLYHLEYPDAWKKGIFMLSISQEILDLNNSLKSRASEIIRLQEQGKSEEELSESINAINNACQQMNKWVFEETRKIIQTTDKKIILLGGDHSVPLGYLKALAQKHDSFGIVQIDAHADLRDTYEGFTYSHASIMFNALKIDSIKSVKTLGLRDVCEKEISFAETNENLSFVFDQNIQQQKFKGINWLTQVQKIIEDLPQNIYISFDIDGLHPSNCPNTGTPVPSGLEYQEAIEIIRQIKQSGRKIIGADLCEVGNNDWDANVGARILYELCVHLI